jgi:nucleoside-diphosphate-sugar epimerase
MKKVLIIGMDSFTGQYLQSYLTKYRFDVYGTTYGNHSDRVYKCDITIKDEIKNIIKKVKPEYIINLAAISFVGNEQKELFYKVNVLAVENILDSIVEIENYKPEKVILVSSATVYGNQNENLLDESMCPNPVNHYGISKLAMEQLAKTYFDKLNIIITRPFNYTGVGQAEHFLIPKIVKHFKEKRKEIELGNIEVFREFNDIEFVCEIYRKLLESNTANNIVNIASNRVIALKDVITHMGKISGYEINIKINPLFVRENEIIRLSGSTDKLYSLIGNMEQQEFKNTLKDMYND